MKPKKLHKTAPILSELSLKPKAFKIPENYFENFEDGIIAELKAQNLAEKYKGGSFKVSENYLDLIDNQIISKLEISKNPIEKQTKVRSLQYPILKYVIGSAVAASIAILFFMNSTKSSNVTFDSLTTNEIENSIDNGIVVVNQVTLAVAFPEVDFSKNTPNLSISDDDILEYLNSESLETIIYEN